jgi:hypothetical protein
MVRAGFHWCIDPYLRAIPPLVWSAALLLACFCARQSLLLCCSLPLLAFLPPVVANIARNWVMGDRAEQGSSHRPFLSVELEERAVPAGVVTVLMISGVGWFLLSEGPVAFASSVLFVLGLWRTVAGSGCHQTLRDTSQLPSMPSYRVSVLRRARVACWTLLAAAASLWLAAIVTW